MKPTPWSFTALEGVKNCPHQFHEVKVAKRVADTFNDGGWGDWVHKQIEAHYKHGTPWHENIVPYVPQIERAADWAGTGIRWFELKMGISTQLQGVGFFHENVWGRSIIDYLVVRPDEGVARAIDWKTGKMKPENRQLRLFALFVFYHYPRVNTLDTSFEWLQHGKFTRATFHRDQLEALWREWMPDLVFYRDRFVQNDFFKRPSGLCNGWCPVTDCEHWKPKR